AAVVALDAAQIDGDLGLKRRVHRLAEVMPQQHVFGGNGRVGLELEHPVAVRPLLREQRLPCLLDVPFETIAERTRDRLLRRRLEGLFDGVFHHCNFAMISAARLPDRIAPSMVAGRPVSVQSPARMRLRHPVAGPGRLASCAGVAEKVARRSRTICQGGSPPGSAAGNPVIRAISSQIVLASSSRGPSMSRSPALMVTDSLPGKANSHCTVPLSTPRIGGCPAGGSIRKCALTMARNSLGASRPGTRDVAT